MQNESKYKVGDERWQKPGYEQTDDHPVLFVNWQNAVDFCTWLSQKEGKKYRIPTEAEWEYSARVGKTGDRYGFGNSIPDLDLYGWTLQNAGKKMHPVGQKKENPWGLYDMHGNVWEWCQDWFDANYYKACPKQNPQGPITGQRRVFRGGSWDDAPARCRSAFRLHNDPTRRDEFLSFRVVLIASPPAAIRP